MYPKLSSRILLVAALYVLTFLAPILRGAEPEEEPRYKPRYTLWAFTATGADSNDFDINDYSTDHDHAVIYIRNLKNKKKVWQAEVAFPRPMAFQLRMAPDKKHAVLFFTDFGRTQSIDWLHLPEGKPKAKWIDIEELEKQALKACGKVEPGWVAKFPSWFWCYFLDWDAQGRCRIKWEYSVSHEGADDTTNTGIAIRQSFSPNNPPPGASPHRAHHPQAAGCFATSQKDRIGSEGRKTNPPYRWPAKVAADRSRIR